MELKLWCPTVLMGLAIDKNKARSYNIITVLMSQLEKRQVSMMKQRVFLQGDSQWYSTNAMGNVRHNGFRNVYRKAKGCVVNSSINVNLDLCF